MSNFLHPLGKVDHQICPSQLTTDYSDYSSKTHSAVCDLPHYLKSYTNLMHLDSEGNLNLKTDMLPQTLSHTLIQGGTHRRT